MIGFHSMGLDDRLLKAIARLGWKEPTLIQEKAIPLVIEGKDVLARARTGSGKTGAFAVPLLQRVLMVKSAAREQKTLALVLAPSKELCHQIYKHMLELSSSCSRDISIVDVSAYSELYAAKSRLNERPDIVVSTPTKILAHLEQKNIALKDSLEMLVVDEADLVFSFGFEKDLKALLQHLPKIHQSILASATLSDDVMTLKKLVLHNPVILKLQEPLIPSSCQLAHYVIRAEEEDKFVLIYALFKLNLVRGKSIIFVNNVDRSYKLKLYLEMFGIKSCVLNSELPQMSRWHTVQQFNLGLYNIIIASDDRNLDEQAPASETKSEPATDEPDKKKRKQDKEAGVSRGIDFQYVSNVINFDFPLDSASYLHRVGRTARGNNQGAALSFVNIKEEPLVDEVEEVMEQLSGESEKKMKPFNFKMDEVEGFRYRAKDASKAVTKIAVREARLKEIRQEIMNSQKLKTYFESNPQELKALKHDKVLHTVKPQPHLKNVPDYIVPKTLKSLRRGRSEYTGDTAGPSSALASNKRRKTSSSKKSAAQRFQKRDPLHSLEFSGLNKKKRKGPKHAKA